VLGEYTEWDSEASVIGATLLANFIGTDKQEFCINVKKLFARNMVKDLLSFLMEGVDRDEIAKMVEGNFFLRFKVDVPVVLLGGPVRAYVEDLKKRIDAEILVPEYSQVGNAVGALVGKGTKRVEITVRTTYSESRYDMRTKGVFVYTPVGRRHFVIRNEALEFAEEFGRKLIFDYMAESGLSPEQVTVSVKKEDILVHKGDIPLETRFVFEGVSNSDVYEKVVSGNKMLSKSYGELEEQLQSGE
jgi:N-methylhydantoinase A/oxoprolinase/acetone carboxylase beta subunit